MDKQKRPGPAADTPAKAVRPKEAERLLRIGHTKCYQLLGSGALESVLIGRRTRLITLRSINRLLGLEEDAA
jgi:hypothetical protein